ncbi:MAG TPA: hypothetical protein VFJ58_02030 [Armatimonadota bacterium]|nr:hypothetical protein [Armatimonadota bacterium]
MLEMSEDHRVSGGDFDLAVIGAGFGGSLIALIARRIGLRVLLVERGAHPRFTIGESTSPLSNLVLEQLCRHYDIPQLLPLASYGDWKRTYPEITCGLKRGFSFYHHQAGVRFQPRDDRRNELLVAASPSDRVADTQWLRSDVDHFFTQQSIDSGVEYRDRTTIEDILADGREMRMTGRTEGRSWRARSAFLIDATGPRGAASRMFGVGEAPWPFLGGAAALFSHFEGVPAFEDPGAACPRRTARDGEPYPPEWAASHHVFDGGWIWSLRFDHGVTSIGIVCQQRLAEELELSSGDTGWQRIPNRYPGLEMLRGARPIRPFSYIPSLSYRAARAIGPGWAMLPSAAAFVDPFLSSGIPLTLLGVERLAAMLRHAYRGGKLDREILNAGLRKYEAAIFAEADTMAGYIAGCYDAFPHFDLLSSYLMYYFAASSFAEMQRRLARSAPAEREAPDPTHSREGALPGSYMLANDRKFQAAIAESRRALEQWNKPGVSPTTSEIVAFRRHARLSIELVNIAGLADPDRRNWYPVDLEDLVRSAHRLGLSESDMRSFIATMPV